MFLLEGLIALPWWGYIVVALVFTHITIAGVTIYLHRHQAHRALDMHPIASHFFRFWLWLTTGMVTKEWAAIHRKHHAKVETAEDPHSPVIHGIKKLVWDGTSLYRQASRDKSIMEKYGHGTPDDWIERNLYTRYSGRGILIMMAIDLLCFGPIGLTIWAVQMVWIPFFAAGIINGVGHWWGYRNYEVADTSTNIVPWGIIIGGEELHNNHHTFGSSAKLSSKWFEFDIGWMYIRMMEMVGLATVKKIPPELTCDTAKQHIDIETVKAVINGRFVVLSHFLRDVVLRVHREELKKAKPTCRESWALLKSTRQLLVREDALLDEGSRTSLRQVLERNDQLKTVHTMKEKLAEVWQRSATTQENLVQALQDWCREAEATRIEALHGFARKLRSYRLVPVPA
jgi:stearoyl-CoA desaturase (Delta-9 desaturase)